jgi:hypothetical protein
MANTTKNRASKCVMARIMRQGEAHQKNFGLREYRTWKAAEEAAQKWIRKMKKELPPEAERRGRMTKRNKSGIVGVWPRITNFKSKNSDIDYCRWYSRWPGCPLKGGISFSAEIFGDDEAFAMAYLAREHETIDRQFIEKKFKQFKKTKKYEKLIEQKKLEFAEKKKSSKK